MQYQPPLTVSRTQTQPEAPRDAILDGAGSSIAYGFLSGVFQLIDSFMLVATPPNGPLGATKASIAINERTTRQWFRYRRGLLLPIESRQDVQRSRRNTVGSIPLAPGS